MGRGFIGDAAVKYFESVVDALESAKELSGIPYNLTADGKGSNYSTGAGSNSNIVVIDSIYKNGASSLLQTDELIEGRIRSVIAQLEDACNTIFKMPATTARIRVVLGEIRSYANIYSRSTVYANDDITRFLSEIGAIDSGSIRVYNSNDIGIHLEHSSAQFTRQINALINKRSELEATLQARQISLRASETSLTSIQTGLTSGSVNTKSNVSAMQSNITNMQNNIRMLNSQIRDLNSQISEFNNCIELLDTIKNETSTTVLSLSESVMSTDRTNAAGIRGLCKQTMSYVEDLQRLEDSISTGMNAAVVKERIGLVSCSDTLDALLRVLAMLEETDRIAIFEIVLYASRPYRCLFFAFADKINIKTLEAVNADGDPTAFFQNGNGTIHLNMAIERDNYFVFFHEIGHMIDWHLGKGVGYFSNSMSPNSQLFFDAAKEDVKKRLNSVASNIIAKPPYSTDSEISPAMNIYINSLREQAIDNIMAGKSVEIARNDVEELQLEVQNRMNSILRGDGNNMRTADNMVNPSNIYGGITNNAVVGSYGHTLKNYWYDSKGNATGLHQVEFFGNHFASAMRNDIIAMQNERDFFPTAFEVFDDMKTDMVSKAGLG